MAGWFRLVEAIPRKETNNEPVLPPNESGVARVADICRICKLFLDYLV